MNRAGPLPSLVEMSDRLMRDAGAVVHRRLEIMAEALCDPAGADRAELALMADEKVAALQETVQRTASGAEALAGRMAGAWMTEAPAASRALDQVMSAPDAVRAVAVQAQWVLGWWARAADTALAMNAEAAHLQAEMLAPVQAAVSANARRLARNSRETPHVRL